MNTQSSLYALTNPNYYDNDNNGFIEYISNVLGQAMLSGAGVLGKPLALIVNIVGLILFIVLYIIFVVSGLANNIVVFPFPDTIVFNGVSMLDPNFINPTGDSGAIVSIMQGVIQNIYYSFFVLAGSVFVIAAVAIGIKLAFSSIASEKAQYKTAIKHYLIGILLLFLMHFILTGMFAINEKICMEASNICSNVVIKIDAFPVVARKSTGQKLRG